jgi:hypothetical protein
MIIVREKIYMKKLIFLVPFFIINLYGQAEFRLMFNFSKPDSNPVFQNIFLHDFNNDEIDDIAVSFVHQGNINILFFDSLGVQLGQYLCSLDSSRELKKVALLKSNGKDYLALLYRYGTKIYFLDIKDPLTNTIVYSREDTAKLQYTDTLKIDNLVTTKINDQESLLFIGYTSYEYFSIPGGFWTIYEHQFLPIYKFQNSFLTKVDEFTQCSDILPTSNIGIGHTHEYTWTTGEDWIYKTDFSSVPFSRSLLYEFEDINPYCKLLSSDDITNIDYGIVLYRRIHPSSTEMYCISNTGSLLWEKDEQFLLDYLNFDASSNLGMNDGRYTCYFQGYRLEILDRINGATVHYESVNIAPFKILTTQENNFNYFITKNQNNFSVYALKEINFIINDINSLDDNLYSFALSQNYPNPFNPSTTIKYQIPKISFVTVKVYDVLGNEIATLVNEEKLAGEYETEFNAASLPSGIYFYQLRVYPAGSGAGNPSTSSGQGFVETKKMVLLK